MVQMLTRLKPLGRPKQPRPTPKLNNTTVRDFGGGLNVVDSEQNLTSRFSPVFDNMVNYTDRRVGPRQGYEMWLKLKQGTETTGAATITITTTLEVSIITVNWTAHPFAVGDHVTFSNIPTAFVFNGITAEMLNRTHGVRSVPTANSFEIVVSNIATATGTSGAIATNFVHDTHALGGEPVECRYFSNFVILWTSNGEILRIDRAKTIERIWSSSIAAALPGSPIGWSYTELVAQDIFGTELICSNGREKPLSIDFNRPGIPWVIYLVDPGNSSSNVLVPAFDACKSAFRYFTIHDTDSKDYPDHVNQIRISAKDTSMVFHDAPAPGDSVDIDMGKIVASPEQTVRGFATIKDAVLVISPNSTTLMKYGTNATVGSTTVHDPTPIDTLNGFGSNAPRSIVSIGSDVFMLDFNGVPSAKLSTLSNAVVPERVSNYIETMMSKHIGRMTKETMRLKAFGFYDGKNKLVHFYIPKFDTANVRRLGDDPFYFDVDMATSEITKSALIVRYDAHLLEKDDTVNISGATSFAEIPAAAINGIRTVIGVLNENYILMSIDATLPLATSVRTSGGGNVVDIHPVNDASIGYIYHYVPQLKLFAWSRFKTKPYVDYAGATRAMIFTCGCGTLEGRSFLFTQDGFMVRYGSPDMPIYADWKGMYDKIYQGATSYTINTRVYDPHDGVVYKCLQDTSVGADFQASREQNPEDWEEYKGEPVNFAWELPWSDFGQRQNTKAVRFMHADANGLAQFTTELYTDNIYKDTATGQLTPARAITFVANEAGAYGAGPQVYGAGRRTREQKLWQVPVKCKVLKIRTVGATTQPLSISAYSFMYQKGSMVRG